MYHKLDKSPINLTLQTPGGHLNIKMSSYQYRDLHAKDDRLIFNMWIPVSWKDGLYIETGSRIFT